MFMIAVVYPIKLALKEKVGVQSSKWLESHFTTKKRRMLREQHYAAIFDSSLVKTKKDLENEKSEDQWSKILISFHFLGLFGVLSEGLNLTKPQLNSIAYSALLARRLMLLNWKSDRPPCFDRWICEVMHFPKIEKIRYTLWASTVKYYVV